MQTQALTGNFGKLSKSYSLGRKGVPQSTLEYIVSIPKSHLNVLDVGCGTGIPTRQLAQYFKNVQGTDIDHQMIIEAQKIAIKNINYKVARADKLPFKNGNFDVVTIFSAFHWFDNNPTIKELTRVLGQDGSIVVVNKNDEGDFWAGHRNIMKKYIAGEVIKVKKDYDPAKTLRQAGYQKVATRFFDFSEWYSLDECVTYLQSISIWGLIPKNKHAEALKELMTYCIGRMEHNKIEREVKLVIVSGYKK